MGAWIAQAGAAGYWLQEGLGGNGLQQYAEKPCKNRCGFDSGGLCVKEEQKEAEEEEESRRRMVELMLGPCNYFYNNMQQCLHEEVQPQSPTLHLLDAPPSSSSPHFSMDSTPIELEPDSPLPSGWEKCLDLKTGSIYYLNRSMGLNSSTDPRKSPMYPSKSGRTDLNSWPASPTTSEVTMEASLKSNAKQVTLNMNEKCGGDEGALDLNLSLHVGQSLSKVPPQHVSVAAAKACSSLHPLKFKAPSSVPTSASSSSSSITSSPINSNFPFSHSIMPSKESKPSPPRDIDNPICKQDTNNFSWLVPKESSVGSGFTNSDHLLFEDVSRNAETYGVSDCVGHGSSSAPMVTVACANCLMFVMLSRSNPKCPRCGTCPDHLDFPQMPLKRAKLGFNSSFC